ncbi:class I SAM-dependent methyltransferase [Halosegnis marinus]|uniref:Class I SAM-dependent methyltransferase n=1 Tax=Halosegnis marinus TaxID=3034023 RepID=A0ABD5ZJU9_9EURY|nr:class I SAM-dependent methyltransferase [Halosegnis sp. DT85]
MDDPDAPGEAARVASRDAVRDTYDRIAAHFSETRAHPWPQIEAFLDGRAGDVGLDLGCGNGRHAEPLAARCARVVGLDVSRALLDLAVERARERGVEAAWVQGDAGRLPVRRDAVDLAVYVAALHHLPSRAARRGSLDELARVLAPTGAALVSVWSTTHGKFDATEGFDTVVDWTLPDGETVPRYYHIYDPAEFDADLAASALAVERTFTDSGNCFAVVRVEGKRT